MIEELVLERVVLMYSEFSDEVVVRVVVWYHCPEEVKEKFKERWSEVLEFVSGGSYFSTWERRFGVEEKGKGMRLFQAIECWFDEVGCSYRGRSEKIVDGRVVGVVEYLYFGGSEEVECDEVCNKEDKVRESVS